MPKSTVYDVINNFKAKLSVVRAEGSCRKPGGCDKKLAQKVVRSCKQNPGLSDAERASRYGTSKSTADDKFKFVKREKYCKKFMIWQAICSCGLKSDNIPVKFWPDLASCHYSKLTLKWYEEIGVDLVKKHENPPTAQNSTQSKIFGQ